MDGSGALAPRALPAERSEAGIRPLRPSRVADGMMRLSRAQFEALFEGLDWRRVVPLRVRRPRAAV